MERQVSFAVHGQTLYGMLHVPDGGGRHPAVVMCHGFTGQRIEAHQLFVKAARRFTADGIAALRFDFRGSGESEGEFVEMKLSGEVEDALAAVDLLCRQPEVDASRVGILGLSMGGCVAACVAGRAPRIKALALWAAVARVGELFGRNFTPEAAAALEQRGELDLGGNVISKAFMDDLKTLDALGGLPHFKGKALVVHGSEDPTVPVSEARLYHQHLGERSTLHIIEGADHTFARKEWEREAIERTSDWLRAALEVSKGA